MERGEFLSKFGLGLVVACTGCGLASCGSKGSAPLPSTSVGGGSPPPKGSGNLFTLDLSSQLQNVGDSTVQKSVIVVRLATGDTSDAFTAVQVACTHQGTSINYNTSQKIIICPNHGSEFNQQGAVLLGPAAIPLQRYTVTVTGTQLIVSS